MKKKMQERIDQIRSPANSNAEKKAKTTGSLQTEDSLAKLIRTSEEADMFLAELKTAFQIAKNRQK